MIEWSYHQVPKWVAFCPIKNYWWHIKVKLNLLNQSNTLQKYCPVQQIQVLSFQIFLKLFPEYFWSKVGWIWRLGICKCGICRYRRQLYFIWENVNDQSLLKLDWTLFHIGTIILHLLHHVFCTHSVLSLQNITLFQVTIPSCLHYSKSLLAGFLASTFFYTCPPPESLFP